MRIARIILFSLALLLSGAGCADETVATAQETATTVQSKTAEFTAAIEKAKQEFEKVKAIYRILYPEPASTSSDSVGSSVVETQGVAE
jgi:outer membrane lipoprotein-sorting protein